MDNDMKGKDVDIMTKIKPIQATPDLSGEDAVKLLQQVNTPANEKAINKNNMLRSVLTKIRE